MGIGSNTKEKEHDWYKVVFLKQIERGWTSNQKKNKG